jgi:hypothetical protein
MRFGYFFPDFIPLWLHLFKGLWLIVLERDTAISSDSCYESSTLYIAVHYFNRLDSDGRHLLFLDFSKL